ncbi:MAG: PAS domain-containing protein [Deltaproteobacteria bacterium]|nr:PAS domain-containing protein [Deltaproteobacteria bacterium]
MFLAWEKIVNSLADGILVLDAARKVVYGNSMAARLAEREPAAIPGLSFSELFSEKPVIREPVERLLEKMSSGSVRDLSWLSASGHPFFFDIQVSPLWEEKGESHNGVSPTEAFFGWTLAFQDISPLKKLEEQKRKVDRLALMGTIAAGLAHEIRNPLSGIKGAAQLISRHSTGNKLKEFCEIILRESERVNRLVGDLLDFANPKEMAMGAVNINEILDRVLKLEEKNCRVSKVTVIREYDPSLPFVWGNADRLIQAFLNFVKNAAEAMPKGGTLRVVSKMMTDYRIRRENQTSTRMVAVEIHDSGVGIPPENLDKAFTPFFTTKKSGSGLGLAISQKIVHEQKGTVQIKSVLEKGTTIAVTLRVAHDS